MKHAQKTSLFLVCFLILPILVFGCGGGGGGGGTTATPGIEITRSVHDSSGDDITCLLTDMPTSADRVDIRLGGSDYGTINSIDNTVSLVIDTKILNDGYYPITANVLSNQGKQLATDTTDPILFLWKHYQSNSINPIVLASQNILATYPTLKEPEAGELLTVANINDLGNQYTLLTSLITNNKLDPDDPNNLVFGVVYLPATNADPNIISGFDFTWYTDMQRLQTVDPAVAVEDMKKDPLRGTLILYLPQYGTAAEGIPNLEGALNTIDFTSFEMQGILGLDGVTYALYIPKGDTFD